MPPGFGRCGGASASALRCEGAAGPGFGRNLDAGEEVGDQRQEGKGRSDAVRLLMRGNL